MGGEGDEFVVWEEVSVFRYLGLGGVMGWVVSFLWGGGGLFFFWGVAVHLV